MIAMGCDSALRGSNQAAAGGGSSGRSMRKVVPRPSSEAAT